MASDQIERSVPTFGKVKILGELKKVARPSIIEDIQKNWFNIEITRIISILLWRKKLWRLSRGFIS